MNFSEEILRDPATNIIGRLEEATRKDVRKMSVEACWHRADFNFYKISGPALSCLHPLCNLPNQSVLKRKAWNYCNV